METYKEIDELVKGFTFSIRGLDEVQTDEKGKEHILGAKTAMRELYARLRELIADLEQTNMQMGLALKHERQIEFEHRYLKEAFRINNKIQEIGTQIKEKAQAIRGYRTD